MNQALAREVVETAWSAGVRTFCLCPGGRNAPLVEALEPLRDSGAEVLDFFEERAAGFFALGRSRRDRRPVAVLTTSGTAAAELLPAMVEAYYQGTRLLAITADRPASFRGTGAPQSIEQVNLFGVYARQAFDLDRPGTGWTIDSCCWPVHLNACFDEPLLAGWQAKATGKLKHLEPGSAGLEPHVGTARLDRDIASAAVGIRKPLVILGGLHADEDRGAAAAFCERLAAPVLAEASSHLRHRLPGLCLRSGEGMAATGLRRGCFDAVVRIGDIPSFRIWRDLEALPDLPVISVSRLPWRGLTHGIHQQVAPGIRLPLDALLPGVTFPGDALEAIRSEDERAALGLGRLIGRYPRSEPAVMRQLSARIPPGSFVYLGNSLPIREWNQFALLEATVFDYGENRGANGIDGQLSTFLGWARPGVENWAIVGDLTALYDLPSLWALPAAPSPVRIVVINNGGGRIFRRIFTNPRFQNDHSVGFDLWARMWGAAYSNDPALLPASGHVVIEMIPDQAETDAFWRDAAALSHAQAAEE